MRRKVKIISAAYNDVREARLWYKEKSPELPRKFNNQLKIAIEQLRTLPVTHAIRYKEVRILNVPVFPYAIHYLIENDIIIIIAVHHTAKNPSEWNKRV